MPELGEIKRQMGVAGQVSYTVPITYADEETDTVTFVGNVGGGSVFLVTSDDPDGVLVSEPGRHGDFGPEWVRRFFAGDED
jgi:hypothetical protein